jgi:hypothetical protein
MELLDEIEKRARELGGYSTEIMKMWETGRPIKDVEFEKVRKILIDPEITELLIKQIERTVKDYDYTGIYCIRGEAGSGKSQIALFAQKELEKNIPNVKSHYIRIWGPEALDEIRRSLEGMRGKNVLFIDELDSLLGTLNEEERKKTIEKLGNILTLYAEEPGDNRRIAAILFLNRRSYDAIMKYDQRFYRRIKELEQSIPSDYERLPPEKLPSLMKNILTVIYSAERNIFPRDHVSDVLNMLLEWGKLFIERITGFGSVGTCLKTLIEAYLKILRNLRDDFRILDKIEEGNKIEDVLKDVISRYIGKVEFEVEKMQYIAELTKIEGHGPDLCYEIYPGMLASGRPLRKMNIEIKCGYYGSIRGNKDQLMRYAQSGPLLVIWISKGESEHIEDLVNEIEKASGNPVDYISVPYELLRPAIYLRNPLIFLVNLGIKDSLEAKIKHSLQYTEISAKGPRGAAAEEDLAKYEKIARILFNKLKPNEKDGKQLKLGDAKKRLREAVTSEIGIQMSDDEAESVIKEIFEELERNGFLSKSSERIFLSRLSAWSTRGEEGIKITSRVLMNRLGAASRPSRESKG